MEKIKIMFKLLKKQLLFLDKDFIDLKLIQQINQMNLLSVKYLTLVNKKDILIIILLE
jgi:hypothetical protein